MVFAADMIVKRNRRIFLLRRRLQGSYPRTWCLPGGKLGPEESFEQAAIRECYEETKIMVSKAMFMGTTYHEAVNVVFYLALESEGKGVVAEPDKFTEGHWFQQAKLPTTLIPSLRTFIEKHPRLWYAEGPEIHQLERLQFGQKEMRNRILVPKIPES